LGPSFIKSRLRKIILRLQRATLIGTHAADFPQFGFAFAAGAPAGSAASGDAVLVPRPINRSSTEHTTSRVLCSFTASSSGALAGERRIRLFLDRESKTWMAGTSPAMTGK
jgi:hypothetical protein